MVGERTDPAVAEFAYLFTEDLGKKIGAGFYRRSRPSASGLDPEGEGRTLR
ncbi:hypothetical protein [Halorubrum laminariae]|uniref:Uncharacterized protein n=1 Tax=Halorubrum laminariae TaxID=1433523 RepID=A0ABD6BY68_9EURY|nr:hypothetical protein [Halorubrum laminariae]